MEYHQQDDVSKANNPNLEILDPLSGRDPLWEMDPLPGLTYIYIYMYNIINKAHASEIYRMTGLPPQIV